MSIYMFFSMFGMLAIVTGAAIPFPAPAAVDGTGVIPGMQSRNHTDARLVADSGAYCIVSYPSS